MWDVFCRRGAVSDSVIGADKITECSPQLV
jgi:hypothetical protein